jgi:hypothetical protein
MISKGRDIMLKKWIITGVSAGAGFATMCAALIAGAMWYNGRQQPWRIAAVAATGGEITVTASVQDFKWTDGPVAPGSITGFRVTYTVTNTSEHDVTISPDATVKLRHASDGALDDPPYAITVVTTFLPRGQPVRFHLSVKCVLPEDSRTWKGFLDHFLNDLPRQADGGVVILDTSEHVKFDLPAPRRSPGDIAITFDRQND